MTSIEAVHSEVDAVCQAIKGEPSPSMRKAGVRLLANMYRNLVNKALASEYEVASHVAARIIRYYVEDTFLESGEPLIGVLDAELRFLRENPDYDLADEWYCLQDQYMGECLTSLAQRLILPDQEVAPV